MADIFRGPLFSNKREVAPVLGVTVAFAMSSLLVTTLAIGVIAPPPGAQAFPAPGTHPAHIFAQNQDTTCDSPSTLRADKQLPFFNATHFVQRQHGRVEWLNQDESSGSPKGLLKDAQLPVFVVPHFAPNVKPIAQWLPADTTQDTPKGLTTDKQLPFFVSTNPARPQQHRDESAPDDTTQQFSLVLRTVVAAPFVPGPSFQVPQLLSLGADTSQDTPLSILSGLPPGGSVSLSPLRYWWQPDDSSAGIPKPAFADATAPTFVAPQFQIYWLRPVMDSSSGTPKGLITDAALPVRVPTYGSPEPRRSVVDTSAGSPAGLRAAVAPIVPVQGLSVDRRATLADTSLGMAAPLRAVVPPLPPGAVVYVSPAWSWWQALDVSMSSAKTLYVDVKPAIATPSDRAVGGVSVSDVALSTMTVADRLAGETTLGDGPV